VRPEHPVRDEVSVNFEGYTKDLFAIIALPRFSRVWIVQECATARHDSILALDQAFILFNCLPCLYSLYAYRHEWFTQPDNSGDWPNLRDKDLVSQPWAGSPHPRQPRRSGRFEQLRFGLYYKLCTSTEYSPQECGPCAFSSTVPHDMVYGVLSMASNGFRRLPKQIEPDYTQPFPDFCLSYSAFIAERTGNLSFLW
jgi:hypothetical protein